MLGRSATPEMRTAPDSVSSHQASQRGRLTTSWLCRFASSSIPSRRSSSFRDVHGSVPACSHPRIPASSRCGFMVVPADLRIWAVALVFSPSAVNPRGMASGLNAIIDDRAISTSVAVSAKPTRGVRVLSRDAVARIRSGRRRQCPGKCVSTWRTPSILLKPRGILPTSAEQKHAGRRPHAGITNDFESSRFVGPRLMLGRSATPEMPSTSHQAEHHPRR